MSPPTITTLLHRFVGGRRKNRRRHERHPVRLAAGLTVLDNRHFPKSFKGYTYNLSQSGLSLLLPTIAEDELAIIKVGSSLRVVIAIPSRTLAMAATVIHFGLFNKKKPEAGYILGARIVDASDSQYSCLVEYLNGL